MPVSFVAWHSAHSVLCPHGTKVCVGAPSMQMMHDVSRGAFAAACAASAASRLSARNRTRASGSSAAMLGTLRNGECSSGDGEPACGETASKVRARGAAFGVACGGAASECVMVLAGADRAAVEAWLDQPVAGDMMPTSVRNPMKTGAVAQDVDVTVFNGLRLSSTTFDQDCPTPPPISLVRVFPFACVCVCSAGQAAARA